MAENGVTPTQQAWNRVSDAVKYVEDQSTPFGGKGESPLTNGVQGYWAEITGVNDNNEHSWKLKSSDFSNGLKDHPSGKTGTDNLVSADGDDRLPKGVTIIIYYAGRDSNDKHWYYFDSPYGTSETPKTVGSTNQSSSASSDEWDRSEQSSEDGLKSTELYRLGKEDVTGGVDIIPFYRDVKYDSYGQEKIVNTETKGPTIFALNSINTPGPWLNYNSGTLTHIGPDANSAAHVFSGNLITAINTVGNGLELSGGNVSRDSTGHIVNHTEGTLKTIVIEGDEDLKVSSPSNDTLKIEHKEVQNQGTPFGFSFGYVKNVSVGSETMIFSLFERPFSTTGHLQTPDSSNDLPDVEVNFTSKDPIVITSTDNGDGTYDIETEIDWTKISGWNGGEKQYLRNNQGTVEWVTADTC
jgi:hypothetical protein